jgi:hypothetical protein
MQTTQQQATPEVGKTKLENLRAALAATINKVQSSQTFTTTTEVSSQSMPIVKGTPPKICISGSYGTVVVEFNICGENWLQ